MSAPSPATGRNDVRVAMRLLGVGLEARLAAIDLDVHHGEVLALVGANGAGKSSLLAVLAGDLEPGQGRVSMSAPATATATATAPAGPGVASGEHAQTDLRHIDLASRARLRAVLGQHADALVPLSVATVLALAGVPWGGPRDTPQVLMDAFDLAPLLPRLCAELAGGERQRVQIARVCAQLWDVPTGVLLLDEPANHLDVRHQRALIALLRGRAAFGQAVVLAVHDLNLALAVADRVAVLGAGRLLRAGPPAQALDAATLAAAFGVPLVLADTPAGLRIDPFIGI